MVLEVQVETELSRVDPDAWNAMVDPEDPFMEHAFLLALEQSGSVGPQRSGWLPTHVLVRDGSALVGAAPLYEKDHSYGEFIFDFGWAGAAHRAGLPYYPKLTCAVPFTPAGGRRLLCHPEADTEHVRKLLATAMVEVARQREASSVHVLFCAPEEQALLAKHGFAARETHQYHWLNPGHWQSFDDFLGDLRAPSRKQIRRERKRAQQWGLKLSMLRADEMSDADWDAMWRFYNRTIQYKGSFAYLRRGFFQQLARTHAEHVYAAMAHEGDTPVAGSLFLWKGHSLYGRYWGADRDLEMLHFELCYYLPMEWGLARGMKRFEAGAQGQHKIKRGFLPRACHSAHWLAHPGLHQAVADHVPSEARMNAYEMAHLSELTPFKRG